jgi:hypothetical protein
MVPHGKSSNRQDRTISVTNQLRWENRNMNHSPFGRVGLSGPERVILLSWMIRLRTA